MKQVTMYEANDGKLFRDEMGALQWDIRLDKMAHANKLLEAGSNLYEVLTVMDLYSQGTLNDKREVLEQLTKNTELVISHWQCSEKPGYRVCYIDSDTGKFFVHGDAGSWSGAYGAPVGLDDLCRYAQDTFARTAKVDEPGLN